MKTSFTAVCTTVLLAASVTLGADSSSSGSQPTSPQHGKVKAASPEFERMKSLVGSWTGMVDMGQGPIEMVADYRLLAGGSVLEERVFAGTPNEMITMFYDKDGKLALTHYCMFGNRPAMVMKSADSKTIRFDFDKTCGIDVKKEAHMHALTLTFDDPDTITASCKALMDGKEMPEKPTTLRRVKS